MSIAHRMGLICWVIAGLLLVGSAVHADFSKPTITAVQNLQEDLLLRSRRNVNGADMVALWKRFDQEVTASLNGGVSPLTVENLNQQFAWTDIRIPLTEVGESGDMKTGAIQIKFFPIKGRDKNRSDWMAVYFHGVGVVQAATFHIFHYKDGHYVRGAAMEETNFLNKNDKLQWNSIQIQMETKRGRFSTYFTPPASGARINRIQTSWEWRGDKLRALSWTPEVDFHKKGDAVVSGRGKTIKLD